MLLMCADLCIQLMSFIAEYNYIHANPYMWPKIWRRNRKRIQHPDLIYPGWKLVIPPK